MAVNPNNPNRLDARGLRFVEEYLSDPGGNAAAAAIRAGFPEKSARQRAYELLQRHDVQAEIARRRQKAVDATDATVEWIAGEMLLHASFDPADLVAVQAVEDDGSPKLDADGRPVMQPIAGPEDIARLPAAIRRVIKGWKWSTGGNFTLILVDRQTALDQLAKWRGMFVTRAELSGPDGGPIPVETSDRDRAKALALLLAKLREAGGNVGGTG